MPVQNVNQWTISDTDPKDLRIDKKSRAKKLVLSIFPYDEFRVNNNNLNFCKECFNFMKDFNLLNSDNVAFLQDYDKCAEKKMGGLVDRGMGLSVLKEVNGAPDERMVAGHARYYAGAFVICHGVKYYVSNNWFIRDKDDAMGKWGFVNWILELAEFSEDELEDFKEFYGMLHTINKGEDKLLIDMLRWISQEMTARQEQKAQQNATA